MIGTGLGPDFERFVRDGDLTRQPVSAPPPGTRATVGTGPSAAAEEGSLAGLAFLTLLAGKVRTAETLARDGAESPLDGAPVALRRQSVARTVLAVISSLRGEPADAAFDASIAGARSAGDRWAHALALALWAEHGSRSDAPQAVEHAGAAVRLAERCGDTALLHWADRSRSLAALAVGDFEAARLVAERLRETAPNPTEQARARYVCGLAELRVGNREAATAALQDAADTFSVQGCRLERLPALLWLSVADHAQAPLHLGVARTLTAELEADPAIDRFWSERPALRLELLGSQRLVVGARTVECKTTHATKLIFSLALAGTAGLDADELCERLWPDKERDKALSSLTTATWDARTALASEGWRLSRSDDRLTLDMEGAAIDLDEAVAHLVDHPDDDGVIDRLRRQVLPAWRFEDWVVDIDERRAATLAHHLF